MYEKALSIEDSDYKVWGNYAYALTFGAEPERAGEPFARAIELAEEERQKEPDDSNLLSTLAGYYVMVGEHENGRELLRLAEGLEPTSPSVHATIGETYEDLGDRDTALAWIGRALDGGVLPSHFERRPMLRDLVSDERYRQLAERSRASPTSSEEESEGD